MIKFDEMLLSEETLKTLDVIKDLFNRKEYALVPQAASYLILQGEPIAEEIVGYLHEHGLGVSQNTMLAMSLYYKAAESGNVTAQKRHDEIAGTYIKERCDQGDYEAVVGCALSIKDDNLRLQGFEQICDLIADHFCCEGSYNLTSQFINANDITLIQNMRETYDLALYHIVQEKKKLDFKNPASFDVAL